MWASSAEWKKREGGRKAGSEQGLGSVRPSGVRRCSTYPRMPFVYDLHVSVVDVSFERVHNVCRGGTRGWLEQGLSRSCVMTCLAVMLAVLRSGSTGARGAYSCTAVRGTAAGYRLQNLKVKREGEADPSTSNKLFRPF